MPKSLFSFSFMLNNNILFHVFSIFLVFSALMVVVSKHSVFSLVFLVSSFLFSAFLLFLLECEFLALLFIVIYVGAIAILFLFAVMMLESKLSNLHRNLMKYLPVGFLFGGIMLFFLSIEISEGYETNMYSGSFYFNELQNWYDLIDSVTDVEVYGQVLYSYFVLQVLIAGLILLLVLIGVVYLTNTYNVDKQTLAQSTFKQLARKSQFFKLIP
jgi:NADH-quinone oxidoreductase subunit J